MRGPHYACDDDAAPESPPAASTVPDVEAQVIACYDAHHAQLRRHLRRGLGGSLEDCEEVVQDTFVRLLGVMRAGTDVIETPFAWLAKTARRMLLNRILRARTFARLRPDVTAYLTARAPAMLSEGRVRRRELGAVIKAALARMTPDERRCLLAYVDGAKIKDIAVAEHLSRWRVGALIRRGIETVRQCLEADRDA